MNSKFLKKLALCLIISICASGNIVQSTERGECSHLVNKFFNNSSNSYNNYNENEKYVMEQLNSIGDCEKFGISYCVLWGR